MSTERAAQIVWLVLGWTTGADFFPVVLVKRGVEIEDNRVEQVGWVVFFADHLVGVDCLNTGKEAVVGSWVFTPFAERGFSIGGTVRDYRYIRPGGAGSDICGRVITTAK